MEKLLLISASNSLENRLGNLIEATSDLGRVSSWDEAHRALSKSSPAAVLIDADLADPSTVSELVRLDNVLTKDDKPAYFVGQDDQGQLREWAGMFDSVQAVVSPADRPRKLREHVESHLSETCDSAEADAGDDRSGDEPDESTEVVVRLPKIDDGTLKNLSLGRILYILNIREQTGALKLSTDNMDRSFAFQEGRFVDAPNHDDRRALTGAFAWPKGDFQFEPRNSLSGSASSTSAVIIEGLSTHRAHRQLMNGLMSRMQAYPVVTQLWDHRRSDLDWDILEPFLDHCDGRTDLETIFSQLGDRVTTAFQAAAFARDTDLIVFRGQQTPGGVELEYDHDTTTSSSDNRAESTAESSKAERATGTERLELKRELNTFLDELESMSSHDIFGLWEGCGRELVKKTYYRMVKEHHPDVYGGNVSPRIRATAQEIFVQIREAYTELLKAEDEQTQPPPDNFDASKSPRKRREQVKTLKPGQARSPVAPEPDDQDDRQDSADDSARQQQPSRQKRASTPIGLGREPSSAHPDLEQSQNRREDQGRNTATNSSCGSADSAAGADSNGGDNDDKDDEEWRRKRLEKLQNSSRKRRRSSSTTGSTAGSSAGADTSSESIPSPDDSSSQSSKDPEKRAQEAFNAGYKHYKNERYPKALPLFEKAHELDSEHGLYMTFLANTLFQVEPDQADRSIELLKSAIETQNRQALPDAHLFLGNILKVKDSEHTAYKHFKRALELNPQSRDAQREIRLYERRHGKDENDDNEESGGFLNKLFKN